jgi:hypothetical protein
VRGGGEEVAARENLMRERKRREGTRMGEGVGAPRRAGLGWTGLGQAGLGHVSGRNPMTRTTADRKPIAKRNPK